MKRENRNIEDLIGRKWEWSKLVVLGEAEKIKGKRYVLCKCECGNDKIVRLDSFISKKIRSCGCLHKEVFTKHGYSYEPLYRVYSGMIGRCSKRKNQQESYKKLGIDVCDAWKEDINLFVKWAYDNGYEEGLQLDRIKNNRGYSPDNCRFVTRFINNQNKDLIQSNNTSGYRGVRQRKSGKFRVVLGYNGERVLNKSGFKTAEEAARYRDKYIIDNNLPLKLNFPELREENNE